jgi:hypothetical protein
MGHELYLSHGELISLDIDNKHSDPLCTNISGRILYGPVECEDANGTIDPEASKAGYIAYLYFNQALAMEYGIKVKDVDSLKSICNPALNEFDHTLISQETIREIGPVSNPNFMIIERFGIAAYWRKKGVSVQILKGIIRQMKGKCGYIIILDPKPVLSGDDWEDHYEKYGVDLTGLERNPVTAQQKLNAFFRRCGFRILKKYGNVFVCNVDQFTAMPQKISLSR